MYIAPVICRYCEGVQFELRRRIVSNGAVQYLQQCLTCGHAASTAQKKSMICNLDRVRDWDTELETDYWEKRRTEDLASKRAAHAEYLNSPQWRSLRRLVLARSNGKCEGCATGIPTQVHHLTYENWGNEFLWELVAVCEECHGRAHKDRQP